MSWTVDLVTGVAEMLAAAEVGAWRPTGTYVDGETAIVLGPPPQSPERAVALTSYPVSDDAELSDVVVGLQVRFRGSRDPRDVDDLADAVYEVLHGARGLVLGGVHTAQIYRQSALPLGLDGNARPERADNYYLQAARPTAWRTD